MDDQRKILIRTPFEYCTHVINKQMGLTNIYINSIRNYTETQSN